MTMELVYKSFDELTNKELYEILKIRSSVFVVEQNCVYQDIDGIDLDSMHFFLKEDEKIYAYLRSFIKEEGVIQIGRVLTTKRREGLGQRLLKEAKYKESRNTGLLVGFILLLISWLI